MVGSNSIALLIDAAKHALAKAVKSFADSREARARATKLADDSDRAQIEAQRLHDAGINHQIEAGKALAKLKAAKPEGREWGAYVKEHFGLSKSRANELIRIAVGKTTVAKARASKAKSQAKANARRPPSKGNGGRRESDEPEPDIEDDVEPENYRTAFLLRADNAIRSAVYSGPVKSDLPLIARQVADQWNSLADTMERVLCVGNPPDIRSSLDSKMKTTVHLRLSGLIAK